MLKLLEIYSNAALVLYEAEEKAYPEIADWNVKYRTFSPYRQTYISIPRGWAEDKLHQFLSERRGACIYNVVANRPILGPTDKIENIESIIKNQQVVIHGKPYIDLRGLHVYIASKVAWEQRSDVDLRFSTNRYPYQYVDPEIDQILNADYDILDRPDLR